MDNFIDGDANNARHNSVVHSRSQAFSRNGLSSPSSSPVSRLVKTRSVFKDDGYEILLFIFEIYYRWASPDGSSGNGGALRPHPTSLRRFLASSCRQANLSSFNFLLISYLPRNHDHRIKGMSRRSPKYVRTQAECRLPFFAPQLCPRIFPRQFNRNPQSR